MGGGDIFRIRYLNFRLSMQLTSEQVVSTYIARVRQVDPVLNAVVEDRFEAALQDSRRADTLIAKANTEFDRVALFTRYPLLGVPFTVKESCGLKGKQHKSLSLCFSCSTPLLKVPPLPWAALCAKR